MAVHIDLTSYDIKHQELMRYLVVAGWNDLNPRLDCRGFFNYRGVLTLL